MEIDKVQFSPRAKAEKEITDAYAVEVLKQNKREGRAFAFLPFKAKEWKFKELQYVPNASTWLNQERWADEVQAEQKKADPLDDLDLENNPFDF